MPWMRIPWIRLSWINWWRITECGWEPLLRITGWTVNGDSGHSLPETRKSGGRLWNWGNRRWTMQRHLMRWILCSGWHMMAMIILFRRIIPSSGSIWQSVFGKLPHTVRMWKWLWNIKNMNHSHTSLPVMFQGFCCYVRKSDWIM